MTKRGWKHRKGAWWLVLGALTPLVLQFLPPVPLGFLAPACVFAALLAGAAFYSSLNLPLAKFYRGLSHTLSLYSARVLFDTPIPWCMELVGGTSFHTSHKCLCKNTSPIPNTRVISAIEMSDVTPPCILLISLYCYIFGWPLVLGFFDSAYVFR